MCKIRNKKKNFSNQQLTILNSQKCFKPFMYSVNLHDVQNSHSYLKPLTTIICTVINSALTLSCCFFTDEQLFVRWLSSWMPHEWDKNKRIPYNLCLRCFLVYFFYIQLNSFLLLIFFSRHFFFLSYVTIIQNTL